MIQVLHVDDDNNEHVLLSHYLDRVTDELRICYASSGKEALEKLKSVEFDCVLSDYQMPGMTGLDLLKTVKKSNSSLPFIFITGQGSEQLAAEALREGAEDYFTKDQGFAHYERLVNSIKKHSRQYKHFLSHKMLEDTTREQAKNLQLMFKNSINALALHRIVLNKQDEPIDYIFEEVNKAFEDQTGLKREHILGKRVTEVLPGIGDQGFDWIKAYSEVALTGKSIHLEEYSEQIKKWFEISAYSPKKYYFVTSFLDVTERRKAAEEIERREERFRIASQASYDLIYEWDLDSDGLEWFGDIDAQLGYPPGTIKHTLDAWEELLDPEQKEEVLEQLEDQRYAEDEFRLEYRMRRADGTYAHWRERGLGIADESGNVARRIGVCEDISEQVEAKLAAEESRNWLSGIYNGISDSVFIHPWQERGFGTFADVNETACQNTGYTRQELLQMCPSELAPDEVATKHAHEAIRKALLDEGYRIFESVYQKKTGENFPVEIHSRIVDLNGRKMIVSVVRDISNRIQHREKLEKSEGRFRKFFENNHIVMLIVKPEISQIVDANPAAASFYGWSIEELKQKKVSEINLLSKEEIEQEMQKALEQKKGFFEFRHRLASGEVRDVDVYSGPVEIDEEQLLYSIVIDMSDRREMEQQLLDSNRTLIEAETLGGIGSWSWNIDTDRFVWSDSLFDLYGFTRSAGVPSPSEFMDIILPEDRDKTQKAHEALLETGRYECEFRIRKKDTKELRFIHARGKITSKRGEQGQIYIGVAKDLTEGRLAEQNLTRLNAELERTNKELEAFTYSVSHDLKAPVRQMYGFVTILSEYLENSEDKDVLKILGNIKKTSENMISLVEAMLSLSRVQQQKLTINSVNIARIAVLVHEEQQELNPEYSVKLELPDSIVVRADGDIMKILLENLIGNAWKFMKNTGNALIRIGMENKTDGAVLFVEDNGPGFDQEKAELIFEPFRRLVSDKEYPGTGIGLATVKRIVNRHGWSISAHSKPGEGARFEIIIPKD